MSLFWLSFADPDKPKGSQFLGVILVDAPDFGHAMYQINAARINPGGEVVSWEIDTEAAGPEFATKPRLTLLSKADLDSWGESKDNPDTSDAVGIVCADCNPSSRSVS